MDKNIEVLQKKLINSGKAKVKVLNQLSQAYLDKLPDKSLEYGKQALELAERSNNEKEKVNSLNNIGLAYNKLRNIENSLKYYNEALQIAKNINFKKGTALSLFYIANNNRILAKYEKSIKFSLKAYQIYEDGTYLQFSNNYHRVVVQLLTWAIKVAELNNERFIPIVYQRAEKSLDFLYNSMDLDSGYLPNYGSNDGALFFKLNSIDYRDYRPQLQPLAYILGKEKDQR